MTAPANPDLPAGTLRRGWAADPLIVCGGRDVDNHGRHTGDPCTNTYRPHYHDPGNEQARAAGWGILRLPDGTVTAICPRCRRPDPATVAACHQLAASTHEVGSYG